jgi:hypothetical protein
MSLLDITRARLSAADGAASRRSGRRSDVIIYPVMHDEPLVWMLRSVFPRSCQHRRELLRFRFVNAQYDFENKKSTFNCPAASTADVTG